MIGEDFLYDGIWLSDYNMKMYDPEEKQSFVQREIDKSELSPNRNIVNHYSVSYSDCLTLSFLIIKDDTVFKGGQQDLVIHNSEINEIYSWLDSPQAPKEFYLVDKYNDMETYYIGLFTNIQPFIVAEKCYGLYLTFTCNSPFGLSPIVSKKINIKSGETETLLTFDNQSSEKYKYNYPTITINSTSTFQNNEIIKIINLNDNSKEMRVTLPQGKTSITIDTQRKIIFDNDEKILSLSDIGVTMEDIFNLSTYVYKFYWLRLAHGENNLKIITQSNNLIDNVEIKTRFIIKTGGM